MARQNHNFPTRVMKQKKGRQKEKEQAWGQGRGRQSGETKVDGGVLTGRRTKARARNKFFRKEKERLLESRASRA